MSIIAKEDWDSTFQLMSWWEKDKIKQAKVMVVGAGALGNEVLKNLALLGVGNIFIIDFDIIEYHNLCRSVLFRGSDVSSKKSKAEMAALRLKEINPEVKTHVVHGDIYTDVGLGVFRRMDAIIGCTDNRLARIAINRYAFWVGKPWIDGGLKELMGQVAIYKQGVACYESRLPKSAVEDLRKRLGCPDLARRNESLGRIATTPISSSVVGAVQSQEAIKLINGNTGQLLIGKQLTYHGMFNEVDVFELSNEFNIDALSNQSYDPIIEAPTLSNKSTFAEVLSWAAEYFKSEKLEIRLPNRVVTELVDISKNQFFTVFCSFPKMSDRFLKAIMGEDLQSAPYVSQSIDAIDADSIYTDRTLEEAGIPPFHIIEVLVKDEIHYIELTRDTDYLTFQ